MELEAVYYAAPAPTSNRTLTLLGLVFDRLIFPGVHVPHEGFDFDETAKEYERIRALPNDRPYHVHMLNLMYCALHSQFLGDFCVFAGESRKFSDFERGAPELAHELEVAMFGAPPENYFRTQEPLFIKGLPGTERASVHAPGSLVYPANALLYAARTGAILVNDNPRLPVPSVSTGRDVKTDATQLATIMALESVKLVLPDLPALSPEQIATFRAETKDLVRPFRQGMLQLSKELSAAILSDATLDDVQKQAQLIAETTVGPQLEEIKAELAKPARPWYRRTAVKMVTAAPALVGAFAALPTALAAAVAAATAIPILADVRDGQLQREGIAKRGGFHYLLKVQDLSK